MRIIPLSHCLINPYSKVKSSLDYSNVRKEIIIPLLQQGYAIFQLPCPELCHGGLQRWGQSRSQYDNPFYRQHCRQLISTVVAQFEEYLRCSIPVGPILGIEGSPSCSISYSYDGNWGGEPADSRIQNLFPSPLKPCSEAGVFMELLRECLSEKKLQISFLGVDEENLELSRSRIFEFLGIEYKL